MTRSIKAYLTQKVIALLARRDYTRYELKQKFFEIDDQDTLEQVLDEMESKGYQSDARFLEAYVRSCMNKGWGPLKIKQMLYGKGLYEHDVAQYFSSLDTDWSEIARSVYQRKYAMPISDAKDKAKRWRFMSQRGFDSEQISTCINLD